MLTYACLPGVPGVPGSLFGHETREDGRYIGLITADELLILVTLGYRIR